MVTPSASKRSISARTSAGSAALKPVQERWRWLDLPDRVQSQVEPVSVADDDSAVLIFLSSGRVKAEIGRIELLAAPFVANRQAEMVEVHDRSVAYPHG
jgi:hypothetical protein